MVDLVWTESLWQSPLSLLMKGAYAYYWGRTRTDRFVELGHFLDRLRNDGYNFTTNTNIFHKHRNLHPLNIVTKEKTNDKNTTA